MRSRADTCVQRGGVVLRGICKDFTKNFCFVRALEVSFFSLQEAFLSDSMPNIGQAFMC